MRSYHPELSSHHDKSPSYDAKKSTNGATLERSQDALPHTPRTSSEPLLATTTARCQSRVSPADLEPPGRPGHLMPNVCRCVIVLDNLRARFRCSSLNAPILRPRADSSRKSALPPPFSSRLPHPLSKIPAAWKEPQQKVRWGRSLRFSFKVGTGMRKFLCRITCFTGKSLILEGVPPTS